ncbi:helix-turn-helix transcriptional regulator [Mollicutes bacterium LVI A0039]|nr:helix-turn-helix transcriptional regulator [Mollicutes bacterium LVI A0039]
MKNDKMRERSKQLKISQDQLAVSIGVTRQTINLIEAGNYNPSLKLCLDICYQLNVTLDQIFWRENE